MKSIKHCLKALHQLLNFYHVPSFSIPLWSLAQTSWILACLGDTPDVIHTEVPQVLFSILVFLAAEITLPGEIWTFMWLMILSALKTFSISHYPLCLLRKLCVRTWGMGVGVEWPGQRQCLEHFHGFLFINLVPIFSPSRHKVHFCLPYQIALPADTSLLLTCLFLPASLSK